MDAAAAGLIGDSPIREGVVEGFLLIFLSELGDKTFFIAALLALKYKESRGVVFGASFGALAVMTVISVRQHHYNMSLPARSNNCDITCEPLCASSLPLAANAARRWCSPAHVSAANLAELPFCLQRADRRMRHTLVYPGGAQVGLGLVLHQADELIDTRGVPLDDLVAVALLLYFGIRTLQVRPQKPWSSWVRCLIH